jgi:hypothetical protein
MNGKAAAVIKTAISNLQVLFISFSYKQKITDLVRSGVELRLRDSHDDRKKSVVRL